jgi:cytoskeleton protein RodZ
MEPLGQRLRQMREAAGLSLREMERRTKIPVTALEALERNDLERLPGGIFGRSFVRAYALEVGLDPDATVADFQEQLEEAEREKAARVAARTHVVTHDDRRFLERQRRALMALRIVAVLLVIAVAAVVTWRVGLWLETRDTPPVVEEAPVPAPVAIVPPTPADPLPASSPTAGTEMVLEFDIIDDTWLEVTVDGGAPITRLYRGGEQYRVRVSREVLLDVSNAGALQLRIDGQPAQPLGSVGQRVRTRITPDNAAEFLRAGSE